MIFADLCRDYLEAVRRARVQTGASPELSLRVPLANFLEGVAAHFGREVEFVHEASGAPVGRPDFLLSSQGLRIGYVEAEKPSADLNALTGATKKQNDGFIANLDNFLLTNHLHFKLFVRRECILQARLDDPPATGAIVVSDEQARELETLFDALTRAAPLPIASPRDLAFYLARRARQLRDAVRELFIVANNQPGGELQDAFDAFKQILLPNLAPYLSDEARADPKRPYAFDDIYAQTLAYGLFAARFAHKRGTFSPDSAARTLGANPFLRQLFARFMSDLPASLAWIADDMAAVLAPEDALEAVTREFARRDETDPLLHFYEPFLSQYDPALQDARGVYYTPPAVVSFIARSVHALLQRDFNRPEGLADSNTLLLDPATGTGSFLFGALNEIKRHVDATSGGWSSYVQQTRPHPESGAPQNLLLSRLLGFELIVAPYVVAHLKLGLLMESFQTPAPGRWNVFLTDTLTPVGPQKELPGSRYITQEVEGADDAKGAAPILVVLGNPPYKGHSSNVLRAGSDIATRHRSYYSVDGQPLGERNPKWLQDDYIKFFAFAQQRIADTGEGIVAFITNHGFLDNPTFRGFRRALLDTFDELYFYDLHGSALKSERAPDGSADNNVFDIRPGVCITLAVKRKQDGGERGHAVVQHAHLFGSRESKYETLRETDVMTTPWTRLQPEAPAYLFIPIDDALKAEYERGISIPEAMPVNVLGFQSHRDHFAVDFDKTEIQERLGVLRDETISDQAVATKYSLSDNRDWNLHKSRKVLQSQQDELWKQPIIPCDFRPFDKRWCYFSELAMDYPRRQLIQHVYGKDNLLLNSVRQTKAPSWHHAFASRNPAPAVFIEVKDGSSVFPLYLYPSAMEAQMGETRKPNFAPEFLARLGMALGRELVAPQNLPQGVSAEHIFAWLYAVLQAPTYRERFAPFLRLDFPRVPLPRDFAHFEQLSQLGAQLVALHTLDAQAAPVLRESRHRVSEGGENRVLRARVKYDAANRRVYFNPDAYFENVDEDAFAFRVGGYQPAERWLKDRDTRVLSFDDFAHYRRLLIAQRETLALLPTLDTALGLIASDDEA